MAVEKITNCPFCKKLSIKIIHQPFISRKSMTKSRFGVGGPVYTKEKTEVLSGCEECGKSLKEVEKALNEGEKPKSHEERLKRLQASELPMKIVSKKD